jgi:hypothetical protein
MLCEEKSGNPEPLLKMSQSTAGRPWRAVPCQRLAPFKLAETFFSSFSLIEILLLKTFFWSALRHEPFHKNYGLL